MPTPPTVALIVGSLRKDSVNRKIARALAELTPGLKFEFVEIGDLVHFDQDLETEPPAPWVRFREQIAAADAVVLVTPEYNRGLPSVLKNAVDVGSRPYGKAVWTGKPVGVITAAFGAAGGVAANHQLRQSLTILGAPIMPAPEAAIGNALALFDPEGRLINDGTRGFLTAWGEAFTTWIARVGARA
jgi:chromate reductase